MAYVIHYDIAAFFTAFCIFISLLRNKTISTRIINSFKFLLILIALSSLTDIAAILLLNNPSNWNVHLHWIANLLYHTVFLTVPQVFYYVFYFSTEDNRMPPFWGRALLDIPYLVTLIILYSSPFSNIIFYFDENNFYVRGNGFNILYVCAAFYVIACLYRIFYKKKHFTRYQRFMVIAYMFFSGAALVYQYFKPEQMIMIFVLAVSAMVVYLSLQNPSDYQDKEMKIFNRTAFIEIVSQKLDKANPFTILGLQLSGFSAMESAIGQKNLTELLEQIGNDLNQVSPETSNYRISQSRFAVFLDSNLEKQKEQINTIISYAQSPFRCGELELLINARAVLIKCPEDANNVDDVLELFEHSFVKNLTLADQNIPRANAAVLKQRVKEQHMMEKIKTAIENKTFEVYYQPVFNVKKRRFTCAEALVRMHDGNEGFINPDDFIPLTEKSGLVLQIGQLVFESVCKFVSGEKFKTLGLDYIDVNLSVIQCMQNNLYKLLLQTMDRYKVDYKYIHLEVTEGVTVASKDILRYNMEQLKLNNIHFALDDYGTGYSNTSSLINFPFDCVKIDKKLLWSAMQDKRAYSILEENIAMIKDMKLDVVVEGVESREQAELLEYLGCDYMQGFFYSMPVPERRLIKDLTEL